MIKQLYVASKRSLLFLMYETLVIFFSFLFLMFLSPVLQLLLLIGAKLEHIINKLAYEVASKHAAGRGEGGAVVRPSDKLFWFHSPRLVLVLIHFILFQNAFEFAYFFWTLVSTQASNSCVSDR